MAASYDPTDPRELSPQQRLDAIAAILAVGAGRALPQRGAAPSAPAGDPPDSSRNEVDVSGEMRLHVPRG
jgi:hypothetical protein